MRQTLTGGAGVDWWVEVVEVEVDIFAELGAEWRSGGGGEREQWSVCVGCLEARGEDEGREVVFVL